MLKRSDVKVKYGRRRGSNNEQQSSGLMISEAYLSFSLREIDKFSRKLEIYLSKIVT